MFRDGEGSAAKSRKSEVGLCALNFRCSLGSGRLIPSPGVSCLGDDIFHAAARETRAASIPR